MYSLNMPYSLNPHIPKSMTFQLLLHPFQISELRLPIRRHGHWVWEWLHRQVHRGQGGAQVWDPALVVLVHCRQGQDASWLQNAVDVLQDCVRIGDDVQGVADRDVCEGLLGQLRVLLRVTLIRDVRPRVMKR